MHTPSRVRGFVSLGLILIVVIALAAIVGAGWWASKHVPSTLNQAPVETASTTAKSPEQPAVQPQPQTQPNQPAPANNSGLKTYTNTQYGFSLQYPSSLAPITDPAAMKTQSYFGSTFVTGFTPVVQFQMKAPATAGPAENKIEGDLQVSVATSPTLVASCGSSNQGFVSDGTNHQTTASIGGTQFTQIDGSDSATSNVIGLRSFSAVHGGKCYRIEIVVQSSAITVAPTVTQQQALGDASRWGFPFSSYDIYSAFTTAAQSFRFTK